MGRHPPRNKNRRSLNAIAADIDRSTPKSLAAKLKGLQAKDELSELIRTAHEKHLPITADQIGGTFFHLGIPREIAHSHILSYFIRQGLDLKKAIKATATAIQQYDAARDSK